MKTIKNKILIERVQSTGFIIPNNSEGKVVCIGEEVKGVKVGDNVFFNNRYAEEFKEYLVITDDAILAIGDKDA